MTGVSVLLTVSEVNVKFTLEEAMKDQRYSSTLSLTSALDGVGSQCHTLAILPPGMTPYPLYRRLYRPKDQSGRVRKISPAPGVDPRTILQRVAEPGNISPMRIRLRPYKKCIKL